VYANDSELNMKIKISAISSLIRLLSASASTGREVVQTSKAVEEAEWWNAIHMVETSNAAEDALNGIPVPKAGRVGCGSLDLLAD
jgi:chitodextrinase